jgi:o-succinylbenzoate synthase
VKIDSVELRELRVPLVSAFETSGWREDVKTCIIVELRSGSMSGFGECAVSEGPWYGYETLASAWYVLGEHVVPRIVGKEFGRAGEILEVMEPVRGNNMAKAGVEMAFWDLLGKESGESLSKLLGGTSGSVASGVSVGLQKTRDDLVDTVGRFVEQGYRRIKIKIKPGRDVELVEAVREEFPDTPLMVDANGAYDPHGSAALARLDLFDLLMIEQPFAWDDLVEHARLRKMIRTPVCLDESVAGLNDLESALALDGFDVLNIKPGRLGGLSVSRSVHDVCRGRGLPVWCGGLLETGVGRAANVALASLPGFVMPGDISASNRYFAEDVVEPEFRLGSDGTIRVPTGPGIGVQVLEDRLEKYSVRKKLLKA